MAYQDVLAAREAPALDLDSPRAYDGVRTRRIWAFLLDCSIILLLMLPAAVVVLLLSVVTLGLGLMLYPVLLPVVAIPYVALTMGGRKQATPGMRMMGVRVARQDGAPVDPLFAVLHGVLFWAANAILTPAVLLIGLFTWRKQLLHDLLLGTVVVRAR